jgi:hypothetical protein
LAAEEEVVAVLRMSALCQHISKFNKWEVHLSWDLRELPLLVYNLGNRDVLYNFFTSKGISLSTDTMGDFQVANIPQEKEVISPIINGVNGASIESAEEVVEEITKTILFKYHYRDLEGDHIETTEYDQPRTLNVDADEKKDDDDDSEQLKRALEIVTTVVVRPLIPPDVISSRPASRASSSGSKSDDEEAKPPKKKYTKVPPFVIKSIGEKEMFIHSPGIQKALRSVVKYYPSETLTSKSINIDEPYYIVLHYRNELEAIAMQLEAGLHPRDDNDEENEGKDPKPWPKNAAIDIRALLDFVLDPKTKRKIAAEEERHRQHPPRATFEMLWMIMKPGTFVFNESDGHLNGFVIRSFYSIKDWSTGGISSYRVSTWSLDFNGRFLLESKYFKANKKQERRWSACGRTTEL